MNKLSFKEGLQILLIWIIIWVSACSFDFIWVYLKDELIFYNKFFIRYPQYPFISSFIFSFVLLLAFLNINRLAFTFIFFIVSLINVSGWLNAFIFKAILNSSSINALVNSNPNESLEFILNYITIILPLIILVLAFSLILYFSKVKFKTSIKFNFVTGLILILFLKFNWHDFRNHYYPFSVVESYRDLYRKSELMSNRLEAIEKNKLKVIRNDSTAVNILLVLGETSRRDYFDAFFEGFKSKDRFLLYKNTFANATNTYRSVPMILSKNTTKTFKNVFESPSLISYFKESGFYTSYFTIAPRETYVRKGSILDSYSFEADTSSYAPYTNDLLTTGFDHHLFYPLKDLEERKMYINKFTILHTMGSHLSYEHRYPKEFEILPIHTANDTINAIHNYTNTFFYKRMFFDSLINYVDNNPLPTLLIYVSDHGENLYDDERVLTSHGGFTTSPQVEVPLVFYPNKKFVHKSAEKVRFLKDNLHQRFQTQDLFHTILDLSEIKNNDLDSSLILSKENYNHRNEHYIYV